MFERDIVDIRTEDIAHFTKVLSSHCGDKCFEKDNSVFKDWIEDTAGTKIKCLEHDFDRWKILKIKMQEYEYEEIRKVIDQNFHIIKHMYIHLISISQYPGISMVDLSRFFNQCDMFDGKCFTQTRLDQLYLNSIKDADPKVETVKIMNRWSFIELLVRISKEILIEKKKE